MRPNTPSLDSRQSLRSYVTEYVDQTDGRLGVFLGFPEPDGSFDTVVTISQGTAFTAASVIKLPILHALYARHADDLSALAEPHGLADKNRVGGSGLYHLLGDSTPSLRDLARAMIAISDNAAANELIDHLGIDRINEHARELGMTETRLQRRMMVTSADENLEPQRDLSGDGPANVLSPRDCAELFADVIHETTLPAVAYEDLRIPLRNQKYVSHFPRYLPFETHVEHKTGWVPTAALDAGILMDEDLSEGRPLVFATFVDQIDVYGDGADVLAEIGAAAHAWLAGR